MITKINKKQSILRLLYSLGLYLLIPFVVLRLFFLSIRNPAYCKKLQERFGFVPGPHNTKSPIWIHAVSVGEVHAIRPLVNEITRKYPHHQILITTMTPTGAQAVRQQYGNTVSNYYVPYDLPDAVKRFILHIKPVLLITMETEIWPNLFYICRKFNVPVVMVNARMSEKSFNGYKRFGLLIRSTLSNISVVATRGQADADRFIALGIDPDRVRVSGNLKFDIDFNQTIKDQAAIFRRELSGNRSVWIAASTHDGEEQIIFSAFNRVLARYPDSLLIVAPRHPERSGAIAELSVKSRLRAVRRSQGLNIENHINVFILDTLGELPVYYAASDLAFVGGSLVPVGGHNMLEPASLGIPVITGPYIHNFTEISAMLQEAGAAWMIQDEIQLADKVNALLADADSRKIAGENGSNLVKANRGSTNRLMDILQTYLSGIATSRTG